MEVNQLPTPLSRKDLLENAICNGTINNIPECYSRVECYLKALITGNIDNLPKPVSRLDVYIYNTIIGDTDNIPKPISRSDHYWYAICTGIKNNLPTPISRSDMYEYYMALHCAFKEYKEVIGFKIQEECRRGIIKDLKLYGKTIYKKDGVEVNTWQEGVTIESVGENEKKVIVENRGPKSDINHENYREASILEIGGVELRGFSNGIYDTLEEVDGVFNHVHRVGKTVLDGVNNNARRYE